jgi:diguanylate cyclase (GGDEF)-like protein
MIIAKVVNWKAQGHHRIWLIVLSLVWILLAGIVHYLTGPQYEFHLVFLIPVITVCWFVSFKAGCLTTLLSAAVWLAADWLAAPGSTEVRVLLVNEVVRLSVFSLVVVVVDRLRNTFERESALARVDALTQLPNRRNFYELGDAEIERARRYKHPLTMISLDLDNFKSVNDRDGHDAGDRVLHTVAETPRKNIRSMDVAARIGGDEFMILLPETGGEAVGEIAAKLQQKLTYAMQKEGWPVTGSFGVATFITPPKCMDELIKRADLLLYCAKQKGKNMICHEVIPS